MTKFSGNLRSAVKVPSEHSQIPIFVLPSSDSQRISDASTCPGVFVVGLGLKSVNFMSANFEKFSVLSFVCSMPKVLFTILTYFYFSKEYVFFNQ